MLHTVLLVDDNPADNFIHSRILKRTQCAEEVAVAQNGAEALEWLKTRAQQGQPLPELLFLDINMPVMNGWEFLEAFRQLSAMHKKVPVIAMLTTSLNPADVKRAKGSGLVREYVEKPLTTESLKRVLESFYPDRDAG